ncbi:MAG: VWA domain-containing protein [Planctomycetaceae bacterium]|nr:VWA domain-containing protein [Planctomycetaceae bacterium]
MKTLTSLTALFTCASVLAAAEAGKAPAAPGQDQPRVEVVFVVDTTGSMGGLIAGAKAKIWSIANQIVLGKPKPVVKMGLVPYRDKGDAYVTKVFDLTDNIDQVYTDLMSFRADGGGDGPENVNQALHDAVHKIAWSTDPKTLKIIYLVGDYPPHNEYTDVPTYDKTAKAAIEKGVYINTVLCGGNDEARAVWQEIAKKAEGTFIALQQSGGVQVVATPHDARLAELNEKLVATAVPYGDSKTREKQAHLNEAAKAMPVASAADRASFSLGSGKAAGNDLVEEVVKNKTDLAKLDKAQLPETMQKMTPQQQKEYIDRQNTQRQEILKQIAEVSARRDAHIKAETAKAAASAPKAASFDAKVVETLREQAAKKNLKY